MNYFDKYGLLSHYKDAPCGNGLLYSAEWLVCRNKSFDLSLCEVARWKQIYESCEKLPGLMMRHPEHPDQQGPDDYFGCGTASQILYAPGWDSLAGRILKYGQSQKLLCIPLYNYNNVNPGQLTFNSWLGRFPALIAHLYMSIGVDPGFMLSQAWIVGIEDSSKAKRGEQDRFAIGWHMFQVLYNSRFWNECLNMRDAAMKWHHAFFRVYPYGMSELREEYFKDLNNPLVKELEIAGL